MPRRRHRHRRRPPNPSPSTPGTCARHALPQEVPTAHDGHPALYSSPIAELTGDIPLVPAVMGRLVPQSINLWMGAARDGGQGRAAGSRELGAAPSHGRSMLAWKPAALRPAPARRGLRRLAGRSIDDALLRRAFVLRRWATWDAAGQAGGWGRGPGAVALTCAVPSVAPWPPALPGRLQHRPTHRLPRQSVSCR